MTDPANVRGHSPLALAAAQDMDFPWAETLTGASVRLRNEFGRARETLTFEGVDGARMALQCRGFDPAVDAVGPPVLRLNLGRLGLDVCCERDRLRRLLARLLPEYHLADAGNALIAVWLEFVFLEVIRQLETTLGAPVRITAAGPIGRTPTLVFDLALADHESIALCCAPDDGGGGLADLLMRFWPKHAATASAVPFRVRWIYGHQDLALAEVRSLRRGDVVMLAAPIRTYVVIADRLLASAHARRPQLTSAPAYVTHCGDPFMAEPDDDAVAPDTNRDPTGLTFDELPVRLTCQLGEIDMPLGEIRQLTEGSVLALEKSADSIVDILINGRRMGRGSLVRIGDGVGVRIDALDLDE